MKKPESLKRVLLAHVAALKEDPARLSIFTDAGKVVARATGTLSFAYHYTLNLVVQDYSGPVHDLTLPLLAWIAEKQPDLLERAPNEPFRFESEILYDDARDVSITLDLIERVLVERKAGGGFNVTYLDDRPASDTFDGVCGVPFLRGYLGDDLLVESPNAA
ncbi:phage tail protein [Sphingomonas sp. LT1P40]|uniref:phage tail protein n=1 Tax=Alteristakelama amylovorans TaxID=3096166 RepID=UPI002FC72E71